MRTPLFHFYSPLPREDHLKEDNKGVEMSTQVHSLGQARPEYSEELGGIVSVGFVR